MDDDVLPLRKMLRCRLHKRLMRESRSGDDDRGGVLDCCTGLGRDRYLRDAIDEAVIRDAPCACERVAFSRNRRPEMDLMPGRREIASIGERNVAAAEYRDLHLEAPRAPRPEFDVEAGFLARFL